MKIRKYDEIINENFYSDFGLKEPTHEDMIRNCVVNIVMREKNISEKDFTHYDEVIENVKKLFSEYDKIQIIIEKFKNKRNNYCAEVIYDEIIKDEI